MRIKGERKIWQRKCMPLAKGTKIDENLNEATQRKCIRIKAFAPCRFSRIKIQEMRGYKLDYSVSKCIYPDNIIISLLH